MIQEGRAPQGNPFIGNQDNADVFANSQAIPTESNQAQGIQSDFGQFQQSQIGQVSWTPAVSNSNTGTFAQVQQPAHLQQTPGDFAGMPQSMQSGYSDMQQQTQFDQSGLSSFAQQPAQGAFSDTPQPAQLDQGSFASLTQQDAQPLYSQSVTPMTTTQFTVQEPAPQQSFEEQPVASPARQGIPAGATPAIVFDHVSKVYDAQPDRPALNDISLQVYPGEFVFLVGHSGSGKSTFIRLINRELQVTSGNLWVAGENLSDMRSWRIPYLRRNIGCVFQDFKLLPKKTAFENVAFALEVIGKSKHVIKTQVPEVLRLVGLENAMDKMPDQLSGGEQQRVSIARAIVNRPPVLICDEPTGNLDPQTSLGIMRLLDRINRTGTIVLMATHDKEMVNSLRRRVITLENGILVRDQDKGVYGLDA